jgi:hypothetical protein
MSLKATQSDFLDQVWIDAFRSEKEAQEASTGLETALWRAGGRSTKANPDKENGVWWALEGRTMLQKWADWRTGSHGWKLWSDGNGIPAIEIGMNPVIGGVTVQMHIDRVMVTPEGELIILDLKTGARTPSSDLQLAFYAVGMEKTFGIRPKYGTYWMAREGTTTPLVDLDFYTMEMIEQMVADFDRARQAHLFIANFNHCKMCDLTDKCKWYNKKEA